MEREKYIFLPWMSSICVLVLQRKPCLHLTIRLNSLKNIKHFNAHNSNGKKGKEKKEKNSVCNFSEHMQQKKHSGLQKHLGCYHDY